MKKTAAAMDCEFIYFVVPKTSLDEILKNQAQKSAQEMLLNEDRKIWKEK